jgi:hypothetical protein
MNASIRRTKQEMEACCLVEVPRAMNICYGAYADIRCSGGFTSEGEYVPVTINGAPNWLINGRIVRYIDSMNAFYEKVIEYKHVLLKPQSNWMHMHTQIFECLDKCNDYYVNIIQLWTSSVMHGGEIGKIWDNLKKFKKSKKLLDICNKLHSQFIDRKPLIVIQKKEKGCKKGKGKNSLDTCAICRETQSELVLNCTHAYCNECIQTWAKTCESKSTPITCPYCRAVVQHAVKI